MLKGIPASKGNSFWDHPSFPNPLTKMKIKVAVCPKLRSVTSKYKQSHLEYLRLEHGMCF